MVCGRCRITAIHAAPGKVNEHIAVLRLRNPFARGNSVPATHPPRRRSRIATQHRNVVAPGMEMPRKDLTNLSAPPAIRIFIERSSPCARILLGKRPDMRQHPKVYPMDNRVRPPPPVFLATIRADTTWCLRAAYGYWVIESVETDLPSKPDIRVNASAAGSRKGSTHEAAPDSPSRGNAAVAARPRLQSVPRTAR